MLDAPSSVPMYTAGDFVIFVSPKQWHSTRPMVVPSSTDRLQRVVGAAV